MYVRAINLHFMSRTTTDKKNQKHVIQHIKKICIYQKKAVPLHHENERLRITSIA